MKSQHAVIAVILLLFVALGAAYSRVTPLWSPPDEELHFDYAHFIARSGSLPGGGNERVSLAFHPPLYYLLGSVLCIGVEADIQDVVEVNDGPGFGRIQHSRNETEVARAAYRLRMCTLVLASLTVYCVYFIALMICPGRTALAAAAALFAALNPQFLHVSASISNEPLTVALSSLYLLVLLRYAGSAAAPGLKVWMGVLLGACLLAKASTAFWVPVTGLVVLVKHGRGLRRAAADCTCIFAITGVCAGWWYAANWQMLTTMQTSQPWFLRTAPLSPGYLYDGLLTTFKSFFGWFGALDVELPALAYWVYATLLVLGAVGFVKLCSRRRLNAGQRTAFGVLALALIGGIGIFIMLNMKYYAFLGRYLYVVMAPIAIMVCAGLVDLVPQRLRRYGPVCIVALLTLLCLYSLVYGIRPAYIAPRLHACFDQKDFCCMHSPDHHPVAMVGQTFVANADNLCGLRVVLSRKGVRGRGDIVFSLFEHAPDKSLLHTSALPADAVKDATYYYFTFPPIPHSAGMRYSLVLTLPQQSESGSLFAWHDRQERYAGGSMLLNGEPVEGDMLFSAYCFTGDRPVSPWEGPRVAVINQGMYISVKEMQLYDSMPDGMRRKGPIHEKMQRVHSAIAAPNPLSGTQ